MVGTAAAAPTTWSLTWENDSWWALIWGMPYLDARYTNGMRVVRDQALSPDDTGGLARGARKLSTALHMGDVELVRFAAGQSMFTPAVFYAPSNGADVHPYGAVLSVSGGLAARQAWRLTSLEVSLGMTGPPAFGEPTQVWAHETFGASEPLGWDQQVQAEPVLDIASGIAIPETASITVGPVCARLVPSVRTQLGTRRVSLASGVLAAIGTAGDTTEVRPTQGRTGRSVLAAPTRGTGPVGVSLFAFAEAEAIAHDLILDGGTLRHIPTAGARPLVTELGLGGTARLGPVRVHAVNVLQSPELTTLDITHVYGNITLSVDL